MKTRQAARVVLLDNDDHVAIIHVRQNDYYKIPGGGVEAKERLQEAAQREAQEESGCNAKIIAKLGATRTVFTDRIDLSTVFLARVSGEKTHPHFDDYEKERGFEITWQSNLDDAIDLIEAHSVADDYARKLQQRDLSFLKLARDYLTKHPQQQSGLTLKAAAERLQTSVRTLRYFCDRGYVSSVRRLSNGYRVLNTKQLDLLQILLIMRQAGFSGKDLRHYSRLARQGASTTAERLAILTTRKHQLRQEIIERQQAIDFIERQEEIAAQTRFS